MERIADWFVRCFTDEAILSAIGVTLRMAFFSCLISSVLGITAGLLLERYNFKGKKERLRGGLIIMKLKSIDKDTLETMQFDDIAYIILKEKGKKMKITDIFKIICDALGMTDKEYENQIGDFFTLLATEKRFIQLEKDA